MSANSRDPQFVEHASQVSNMLEKSNLVDGLLPTTQGATIFGVAAFIAKRLIIGSVKAERPTNGEDAIDDERLTQGVAAFDKVVHAMVGDMKKRVNEEIAKK